ncbi:MAG: hypothetical protein MJY99_00215 [Fibrobacter sp.]|uniref:hypothetical protein n=1 Tax=Fibrobacter sp. TaxID=35828 RepID=UPI003890A072|nr:hypothetical protein [Fibrobacter sp.]
MYRLLFFFTLCVLLVGCAGSKSSQSLDTPREDGAQTVAVRDSLRAKFVLTLVDTAGKAQDFDAVLFSVPGKRYRMELTGPMGIGVASLLWQEDGWQMVFPTEKKYVKGAGYMIGLIDDSSIPLVPIHQVANLFEGILLPESYETLSESDSAGFHVVSAKASNGIAFTFGSKDGHVAWYSRMGRDGKPEILRFLNFRTFENVETPENIVFEKEGKRFLEIRIKKVTRKKAFSMGTWRLNIPKSYKSVTE